MWYFDRIILYLNTCVYCYSCEGNNYCEAVKWENIYWQFMFKESTNHSNSGEDKTSNCKDKYWYWYVEINMCTVFEVLIPVWINRSCDRYYRRWYHYKRRKYNEALCASYRHALAHIYIYIYYYECYIKLIIKFNNLIKL